MKREDKIALYILIMVALTIIAIICVHNTINAMYELNSRHTEPTFRNVPRKSSYVAVHKPALKVEPIEDEIVFEPIVFEEETQPEVIVEEYTEEMSNYPLFAKRYYHGITLTDEEIYRLAALVQAEADNIYECRLAIASIVINRMRFHNMGFYDTIYAEGQFVTDWGTIAYADPLDDSIRAVYDVLTYGTVMPVYVMFYRAECYHNWNDQTPYGNIGNSYFSYSLWQK